MQFGIRVKLFGGFGIVLALLAVIGFIGWQNTTLFSADFKSLYADRLVPVVQLGNARTGLLQLRVQAAAYGAQRHPAGAGQSRRTAVAATGRR